MAIDWGDAGDAADALLPARILAKQAECLFRMQMFREESERLMDAYAAELRYFERLAAAQQRDTK